MGHSRYPWKLPDTSLCYISLYKSSQNLLLGPDEALLIALKIAGTSYQAKPDLLGCKLGGEYIFIVLPSNCIPDSVRKS